MNKSKLVLNGEEVQDFDDSKDWIARNGIAIIDDCLFSEEELVIIKSIPSRLDGRYLGNVKQKGGEK